MEPIRIVVRFRPGAAPRYTANAEQRLSNDQAAQWTRLTTRFGPLSLTPRFTAIPPQALQELEIAAGIAASGADAAANSLTQYYVVETPADREPAELLSALLEWPDIDLAFIEPVASDPVNPNDDPRFGGQGYLNSAPMGIGATFAWTLTGGDGAGQHFIDVEQGWTFNHEDLVAKGVILIHGGNSPASYFHGTAVLGEVCAVDNAIGCVGIVPNIATAAAASTTGSSVGNAIVASVAHLTNVIKGTGVILIEQQWINWNGYPNMIVEVASDVFDAIRLATQLGHLVVEAAGNGGHNLDNYQAGSDFVLRRGDPEFRDSGALVVGAASSSLPHARLSFSNYGSRIDCYGWGQNVNTTTSDTGGATNQYTAFFSGTSSASPIVTGAALSVQGMKGASVDKTPFNPGTLRAILADPVLGTKSANPASDLIGVMPNLKLIAGSVLKIAPELYIRDTLADIGKPHNGIASSSPDIIIRSSPISNPQLAFGEGSGTENNINLSDAVAANADHYGFVRIRNRSGVNAAGAVAALYWASAATLVNPSQWNLIGSGTVDVPSGDVLTVAGPFPWPKAKVPPPGHYCFVATVSHNYDLAPDLAILNPIQNFTAFIQTNNNVAWRNFNVADIRPKGPSESSELPFSVPNPDPGPFTDMAVEVWASLPPGSRLLIQMPDYVQPSAGLKPYPGTIPKTIRVELSPAGTSKPFGAQVLPPHSAMTLQAMVPPQYWSSGPFEVYARQLYRGIEVGRITWWLKLINSQRPGAVTA